jgi:hypothetical protein
MTRDPDIIECPHRKETQKRILKHIKNFVQESKSREKSKEGKGASTFLSFTSPNRTLPINIDTTTTMPNEIKDLHKVDATSFPYIFEQNATVPLKAGAGVVRRNL